MLESLFNKVAGIQECSPYSELSIEGIRGTASIMDFVATMLFTQQVFLSKFFIYSIFFLLTPFDT